MRAVAPLTTSTQLLLAVVILSLGTLLAILALVFVGLSPQTQPLVNTILAFVGPTIAILVALIRVDAVSTKVSTVSTDVLTTSGQIAAVQTGVDGLKSTVETVHKLVNSGHDELLAKLAARDEEISTLLTKVGTLAGENTVLHDAAAAKSP